MKLHPRTRALAFALLALPLSPAAFAATITVKDIAVEAAGGFKLVVPSIEATDANLDEAQIRALFSADYTGTLKSLAGLTAASVKVPELSITYSIPGALSGGAAQESVLVYHDLELTDVESGIAKGGLKLGSIEVTTAPNQKVSIGSLSAKYFDIGGIIGFYGLGDQPPSTEMKPIYQDFLMGGITMTGPLFNCSVGPSSGAEFSVRPLKHTLTELMAMSQQIQTSQASHGTPSPEMVAKMVDFYVDLLTAFHSSPMTIGGMNCTGTDETGKPLGITAGEMTIAGFEPGIYPAVGLKDFGIEVPGDGFLKFGDFTWKTTDLSGPIAAVTAAKGMMNDAWFKEHWRELIPSFEGFSLSDFSMDVPDEKSTSNERIVAAVDDVDVMLGDYVNGIPTAISTSGKGLQITVPAGVDGAPLRALGIDKLNLGFDLQAHWNEAEKTISVDNVALVGENLGGIRIGMLIGNAGPELFNDDLKIAQVAMMGLTIKGITLDLENAGIAPKLIAMAAAEQNLPPDQFYLQLAGVARAMPLGLLGATDDAIQLSNALGSFLAGTPKLSITLTSVDPNGIGLAEFMAAQTQGPQVLQGKFKVQSSSEGEQVPFTFPDLGAMTQPEQPQPDQTMAAPEQMAPAPEQTEPPTDESSSAGEKKGNKN